MEMNGIDKYITAYVKDEGICAEVKFGTDALSAEKRKYEMDEVVELLSRKLSLAFMRDEDRKRLVPEGLEWPTYDDGNPVNIGDKIELCDGDTAFVKAIKIMKEGILLCYDNWTDEMYLRGEHPKRAEKDSWEKLEEDANKTTCQYFGMKEGYCDECQGGETDCETLVFKDIVRRAKKLAGIE